MNEEWRAVVGFEGEYQVSNLGRVRSLDRTKMMERTDQYSGRKLIYPRSHKGKLLAPVKKESGHLRVYLGRGNGFHVHTLVLNAFTGPTPDRMECCHNDSDPTNNVHSNLRWDTHTENALDRFRQRTDMVQA